jgi:hypothetical protein
MAACRGVLALALCCWLLPVTITEMSLPMQVSSWDNVEEWRPFVREVAQVVLDHVDSATHVEQILEHRTRVASTVSYQAEVEFAPSSDGRKRAFNATARVFDGAFDWHAVSGTTMHTRIWLDQQRKLHGPPSPPPTAHRLNLLDGRQPRDNQHQHQPSSLLPQEIPNTMVLQVQDAAEFLLTPSVRADQLVGVSVAAPDTLVSGLSILGGVAAELKGVAAMSLADPIPLECDLPFRWHPPMVFPPLEGGRRLAGWFLVTALARVEDGGALSMTLTPSRDPELRSMPRGWVPVGLAGVVATWDVDDDGDDAGEVDEEATQWEAQLLRDLGLDDDDESDEEEDEDEDSDEDAPSASAELLRFMGSGDDETEATMPHELPGQMSSAASASDDLVFFKGVLTDQTTGMPLNFCPGGFSMARSVTTSAVPAIEPDDGDAPLFIENPLATKPPEWDDVDDGTWAPEMIINPSSAASSLLLGAGWEGSYECVGNPTRVSMDILETEPGRAPNTVRLVANMSFDTVTQTGGFAVRPAQAGKPFRFRLEGDDTAAVPGAYRANVVASKQEEPEISAHVVLQPESSSALHVTPPGPPFNINAKDERVVGLLNSVERVFNQTKQVAIRLTSASVQPVVLFNVVIDVAVPNDILRVEAVVERDWGGVERARPVTLKPSLVDSDVARVTSLVSTSLLKKADQALDIVELAEQLKLSPEAVETLQKALMKSTREEEEEEEEEEEKEEDGSAGPSDDSLAVHADSQDVEALAAREEHRRAELLRERIETQTMEDVETDSSVDQGSDDEAEEQGLLAMGGWGIRMVRQTFRRAVDYNVVEALGRLVERGHRQLMGIPIDVRSPIQAGLLLLATIPIVIAFVSLLSLLEIYARRG